MAIDLKPTLQNYQKAVDRLLGAREKALKSLGYRPTDVEDPHKARKAVDEMYKILAQELGIRGDDTTVYNAISASVGVDVSTLGTFAAHYGLTEEIIKEAADREIVDRAINNATFPFTVFTSQEEAKSKINAAVEEMKRYGITYTPSPLETPLDLEARLKEVLTNAVSFIRRKPGKYQLN